MPNRDGKEWLESIMLDEDDMISDSATDVASQQSIKKYVDDAEIAANSYTDSAVTGLATETYVDTAEADAIASSNSYTDSAITGLATETYVDTAEADAIASSNSYTDSAVTGLATETYVDNAVLGLGQVSVTKTAAGATQSTAFSEMYIITNSDVSATTFNLPEITSTSDTGKRIRIMAEEGGAGITIAAYTGQEINGVSSVTETTNPVGTYHLVAVYDATTPFWVMTR